MKKWLLVNALNFICSLSVAIFYAYPQSNSLFVTLFFFMGLVYFNKLLIEQIAKEYGKSVK